MFNKEKKLSINNYFEIKDLIDTPASLMVYQTLDPSILSFAASFPIYIYSPIGSHYPSNFSSEF